METDSDVRRWDEMIPEALSLIFNSLPFKVKLSVIPAVCKPWGKVVVGPDCWREIDIEEWCTGRTWSQLDEIDRMVRLLVPRSGGSMTKLCVSGLQHDATFSFISEHANSLQTLRLRRSEISDSVVEQTFGRFANITFVDLSSCGKIGSRSLKAIGMNCKFLTGLCRNIHPSYSPGIHMHDEAIAIATTMPKLKHLEIAYHVINTQGAIQILESCPELEFLDLRGCWDVLLHNKYFNEKFPKLNVLGPSVDNYSDEELESLECCMSYSEASDEHSPLEYEDYSEDYRSDEYQSDDY